MATDVVLGRLHLMVLCGFVGYIHIIFGLAMIGSVFFGPGNVDIPQLF